jgi:hypothetical protein
MTIFSVTDINHKVITLWDEQFRSLPTPIHWPMISPLSIQTDGLTVVGCNPALPKHGYYTDKIPLFQADSLDERGRIRDKLSALEAEARKSYTYYQLFQNLAKDLQLSMEHVDLFFYRETNQSKVEKLILKDGHLNDFGRRQVELSVNLIRLSRPKIVLVANAFASKIVKSRFSLTELDCDGLYWTILDERKTPVFLSGMLGGQRALDLFSRERLVWHMKRALHIG